MVSPSCKEQNRIPESRLKMDKDRRLLDLTLEIIYLLTGEDYTVVKKTPGGQMPSSSTTPESEGWIKSERSVVGPSPQFLMSDRNNKKILKVTSKLIELLTGEVPIRCRDITVHFSTEEWEFIEGHKDLYKAAIMNSQPPLTSPDTKLCEVRTLLQKMKPSTDYMSESLTLKKNGSHMMENLLDLTLEIIFLMTGQNFSLVKTASLKGIVQSVYTYSGKWNSQACVVEQSSVSERDYLKILQATNKMIFLLTGEVPLRCPEGAVYFSMEECQYLETHKELYKHIMMEDQPSVPSPDGPSTKNPAERCTSPLYTQDSTKEDHNVPQQYQDGGLIHVKVEDSEIEEETQCKETKVPIDGLSNGKTAETGRLSSWDAEQLNHSNTQIYQNEGLIVIKVEAVDDEEAYTRGNDLCMEQENPLMIGTDGQSHREPFCVSPEVKTETDFQAYTSREGPITSGFPGDLSVDLPFDSHTFGVGLPDHVPAMMHHSTHGVGSMTTYPAYDKSLTQDGKVISHQTARTNEHRYTCSECGKVFAQKFHLVTHQRIHTGEKPYSCSLCGKGFTDKANYLRHERMHSDDHPFTCTQCGKSFKLKAHLSIHQRTHTGEKPYSCSVCGRSFTQKFDVVKHERVHTGEKPHTCLECGKCFTVRSALVRHERVHTGEKPYLCPHCGKSFAYKSVLDNHQRKHTGEMPFCCSECGKCFKQRSVLITHQRTHTGVKPFYCSVCGKGFSKKLLMLSHQQLHK